MTDEALATVLAGVRVVEVGSPWTSFAGRVLAGLGAEVVLLHGPAGPTGTDDVDVAHLHWMKHHRQLDLGAEEARSVVADWLARADVVLDGLDPAERDRLGLVPDEVVGRGLVHVTITPWGTGTPQASRPATDLTVTAAAGMMAQVGHPDGPPVPVPSEQAVRLAGVHAAIGVLLARRTGPQHVDVSAARAVAAALETGALTYLYEDRVSPRPGNAHPLVPHQLFAARDGWLAGGLGGSPRMWDGLVEWMAEHDMAGDLADVDRRDPDRLATNRDHVMAAVADFVAGFERDAFAAEAQRRRLPFAPVLEATELADDEHLDSRGGLVDVPLEHGGGRDVDVAVGRLRPAGQADWEPRASRSRSDHHGDREGPLAGVRVLDLSWVLAGPSTTRVLADFGAEVIKVESTSRPDPTRFARMFRLNRDPDADHEASGYFNNVNRGKRSIQVDLRTDEGRRIARRLALAADVVVENYSAGVLERLGLSHADLADEHPDLVVVRLSGLGQTGPRRAWVSYADAIAALSGLTALTRDEAGDPVGVVFGLADLVGGLHGALAVVAGLAASPRGGEIDLSQLEAMVSQIGADPLRASRGLPGGRDAGLTAVVAGIDHRWLVVDARDPSARAALATVLGLTVGDGDDDLRSALARYAEGLPAGLLAADLRGLGVPAEAVADGREIVEHETALRDFYEIVEHPSMGPTVVEGVVSRLSRSPARLHRGAPLLGQDTAAVLAAIDVDATDQARLAEKGILR